jgi:hypothetical protein
MLMHYFCPIFYLIFTNYKFNQFNREQPERPLFPNVNIILTVVRPNYHRVS